MRNTLKKKFKDHRLKVKLVGLMVFVISLSIILLYFAIQKSLKNIQKDFKIYSDSIEHSVYETIHDAQYITYGLANLLAQEAIIKDNLAYALIHSFNPDMISYKSITNIVVDFILIDNNAKVLANTSFPESAPYPYLGAKFDRCLQESNNKFFYLNILPIRNAENNYKMTELIIPLNMPFSNANNRRIGIICSGLKIKEFNERLMSIHMKNDYIANIKIININDNADKDGFDIFSKTNEFFTLKSIIKNIFQSDNIILHKLLLDYPFMIELEIRPEYFRDIIGADFYLYISYIAIFVIFAYSLFIISQNSTHEPMHVAHRKLHLLTKVIGKVPIDVLQEPSILEMQKFSPEKFCYDVNNLIEHCYLLQFNEKERYTKQSTLEIKKEILNLILKERNFLPFAKTESMNGEIDYSDKLLTLLKEELTVSPLLEFLQQVADYCSEFYNKLNIQVIIKREDKKNFIFKQATLLETIFHIFSFIVRGGYNVNGTKFILRGYFSNNNPLPTIIIQTDDYVWLPSVFERLQGPQHIYTGLLPIQVLALENMFFFDIKQTNNQVFFVLEPVGTSNKNKKAITL